MGKANHLELRRAHKNVTVELAQLNQDMAIKLIDLAHQTGEVAPLIEAVKAMRASNEMYCQETANIDLAIMQKKLGDTLLRVGKTEMDKPALDAAIEAYRGAITMASLLGEHKLRTTLRASYTQALKTAGKGGAPKHISLMGAA